MSKRRAPRKKTANKRESLKKISKDVPECNIFQELSSYEKRIDSFLIRKQMALHDAIHSVTSRPMKTISMSIYNTYADQGGSYNVEPNAPAGVPSWILRIEGSVPTTPGSNEKKFTSFFKKLVVQLDPEHYPENNIIEWDRSQDHSLDSDGFEIHRVGDYPTKAKILLHVAYSPARYKLQRNLGEILKLHTETRARIIVRLWQYIKSNGTQDETDRRVFHLNGELEQILGKRTIAFTEMPDLLRGHLSPPDPIEIDYSVQLSGDPMKNIQTYEVQVTDNKQPDTLQQSQELIAIDAKIAGLIGEIDKHRTTRDFLVAFHKEPVEFLNDLVAAQAHNFKLLNSSTKEGEAVRLSGFYQQPLMSEAVSMYLDRNGDNK